MVDVCCLINIEFNWIYIFLKFIYISRRTKSILYNTRVRFFGTCIYLLPNAYTIRRLVSKRLISSPGLIPVRLRIIELAGVLEPVDSNGNKLKCAGKRGRSRIPKPKRDPDSYQRTLQGASEQAVEVRSAFVNLAIVARLSRPIMDKNGGTLFGTSSTTNVILLAKCLTGLYLHDCCWTIESGKRKFSWFGEMNAF